MYKNQVVYEAVSGFVAGFVLTWSGSTVPTKDLLRAAFLKHVSSISITLYDQVLAHLLQQQGVVSESGSGVLRLKRARWRRLKFTQSRAAGFVFGGLAAAYSPITQVSYLRLLLEKIWSPAGNRQMLYDVVERLRREGYVISTTYGSDTDHWYLSLPKELAALDQVVFKPN